jgi:sigma-B regulation protein RsbQ
MSIALSRNNVQLAGTGEQALIFAHGFGCDQSMWRHVAPAFTGTHRVVLFDYVGAGGSDVAAYDVQRYASLQGYASDVLEVLDALDLRHVIFVGHSVSATIGMLAAARRPSRFARLVHVCPSPCFINDPPTYFGGFASDDIYGLLEMMEKNLSGWAGAMAPMVLGPESTPEQTAELEARFCANDPAIARRFGEATFLSDHRIDVPLVPVRSLILQSAHDLLAPESVGQWLARYLPMSTYHMLRATGHCPHVTHPEETIAVIQAYLEAPAGLATLDVAACR